MSSVCAGTWPPAWPSCRASDPRLRHRSGRAGRRTGCRGAAQQRRPRAVHQPGQDVGRAHARRRVALAGDGAATLALARHGVRSCCGSRTRWPPPTGLADALMALRTRDRPRISPIRRTRCSTTRRSTDRCRAAAGARADAGRRADRGGRPGCWAGRRLLVAAEDVPDCSPAASQRARPGGGARRAATGSIGRPAGDGRGLLATGAGIERGNSGTARGALRTYAWGSRTAIAEFTGRPVPAAHPGGRALVRRAPR